MFYASFLLLPAVLALPWIEIQEVRPTDKVSHTGLQFISAEVEPFEQTWASFKVANGGL